MVSLKGDIRWLIRAVLAVRDSVSRDLTTSEWLAVLSEIRSLHGEDELVDPDQRIAAKVFTNHILGLTAEMNAMPGAPTTLVALLASYDAIVLLDATKDGKAWS